MRTFKWAVLISSLVIAADCRAEFSVREEGIPTAARLTRPSGVTFPPSRAEETGLIFAQRFRLPLPKGAGYYDGKPNCSESEVRRKPVYFDSPELRMFDLLVYDYRNPAQTAAADLWDRPTVPYSEGDIVNPYQTGDMQQRWARFFDIRCLPTRVHFPVIDGKRYEEYREGARAFDGDAP